MRHCTSLEDWEDLLRVGLDITSREYKNDSCGYCLSVAAVSHLVDMPQTPKRGYTRTCAHNSSSCIRCSFLIEMHLLAIETSFKMAHFQSIPRSRRGGWENERSPSSARLTRYLLVCGRKHKT